MSCLSDAVLSLQITQISASLCSRAAASQFCRKFAVSRSKILFLNQYQYPAVTVVYTRKHLLSKSDYYYAKISSFTKRLYQGRERRTLGAANQRTQIAHILYDTSEQYHEYVCIWAASSRASTCSRRLTEIFQVFNLLRDHLLYLQHESAHTRDGKSEGKCLHCRLRMKAIVLPV
ncbi:hypothetical protein BD289DRAFT_443828 [Coniella lustricola]|uniref:Uncharacterized protein n=1 Tax=Coniella lustricola TaxID=2025994 RepID=A0A2T2ZWQ6_9PEZI|nr:hypothetical protein BD289DRAFT_443828 [Coniella lustricola]